jgi:hypothetical protein
LPHVDVAGRLEADVWTIKAIVPFVDEITPESIPSLLTEMHNHNLILYYGNGHKYLQIVDFLKYQTVRPDQEAPSHIPDPTEQQSNNGAETELQQLNVSKGNVSKCKVREATHPPFVYIEEQDLKTFYTDYGKTIINEYIQKINDYLSSTGKKPYKDYPATLRNWLRKDAVKKQPKPIVAATQEERPPEISEDQRQANLKMIAEFKTKIGRR